MCARSEVERVLRLTAIAISHMPGSHDLATPRSFLPSQLTSTFSNAALLSSCLRKPAPSFFFFFFFRSFRSCLFLHTHSFVTAFVFTCFHSPTPPVHHNASSVSLARRRPTTEGRPRPVMSSPQKKTTRPFDIHRDDSANSIHHVILPTSAGNSRRRDLTDTCSCRLK